MNKEKEKIKSTIDDILQIKPEKLIPEDIYPVIDTDLARDNLENNIPVADLQDLS